MKALIDLQSKNFYRITGWTTGTNIANETIDIPTYELIPNSKRICQIEENEFEVCPDSLLWVDCNASVTTQDYYYDTSDSTIKQIVNADPPA